MCEAVATAGGGRRRLVLKAIMRAVSLLLALFPLYLPAWSASLCPSVDCSAPLPSTMCYRFNQDSYQIQLKPCSANEVCDLNQMASSYDYNFTSSGQYCKGSSYLPEGKFPGETCKVKQECRSSSCGSGICQGMPVGAVCKSTWECESGVTCQQGICTFQKKEGVSCLEDQGCANNLLCHAGICTAYFSLKTGDSGIENSYLCESGYSEKGVCQNAPANVNLPDSTCTKDSECPLTNGKDGTCLCGLTMEEVAFCDAQPGDEEFAKFQNLLEQVLDTSVDCHYHISLSRRCSRQASNPVFSSYLNAYYIYRYRPQIIGIPSCISSVMPFSLDYSYSNTSLDSSSGTDTTMIIAISVCVVVGLILMGLLCFFCVRRIAIREAREMRVQNALVTGEYGTVDVKEGMVLKQAPGEVWESKFGPEDLKVTVRDLIYLKIGIPVARSISQDTNVPIDGLEAELPTASPKSSKEDTLIDTAGDTKRSSALFFKRSS